MDLDEVMAELQRLGSPDTARVLKNHGAPEAIFGVRVGDLKPIAKRIKGDHALAMKLYATGNSDAMYLAGLVADGDKMSTAEIDTWARTSSWYMIGEYSVAWVAADSRHGLERARAWIRDADPAVACSGWATWSAMVSYYPDDELDMDEISALLDEIGAGVHQAPNRVRYVMNGFVIAVGCFVPALSAKAKEVAAAIGKVHVDMGGTACKVPLATEYIAKVEAAGRAGRKRKEIRC